MRQSTRLFKALTNTLSRPSVAHRASNPAMVAYVIATMTIHDPETYRKYTARTPATVEKYGGRFLTRGSEVLTLDGEQFTERLVILEFPSKEAVDAWHKDPEYVEAAKFRQASSTSRVIVQEGVTSTGTPSANV